MNDPRLLRLAFSSLDSFARMKQLLDDGRDFCDIEEILDREYPLDRADATERITEPAA